MAVQRLSTIPAPGVQVKPGSGLGSVMALRRIGENGYNLGLAGAGDMEFPALRRDLILLRTFRVADVQGDGPVPFHSPRNRSRTLDVSDAGTRRLALAPSARPPASRPAGTPPATRRGAHVPEDLNFANGLFRDRRFGMAAGEYERFLKDAPPGSFANEGRFGLASARLFQGQYEKARRHFEEFLKDAPDHPKASIAWYRVGETAYMLGDLPAARQSLEAYTTNYPKHQYLDTAWPYLGDVCFRLGDLPKAREAYERAGNDFPDGRLADRARLGLGRTLALQQARIDEGGLQGPRRPGREGRSRLVRQGPVPDRAGPHAAGRSEHDKAIEAFDTLEKVSPQSTLVPEARLRRSRGAGEANRLADAEPILRGLIDGEGSRNIAAQAAFILGTAQLGGGKAADALATLDGALGKFGDTSIAPALLFRSAEAKAKLGDAAEARARFLKASELDPKDPWADRALLHAARLALEAGDLAAARALAASFIAKFPDSPLRADARLVEGRAALTAKQPKEAIAFLSDSLASDKPSPETARGQRYYLGLAYRADGQPAKAKELLDALAETPDGAEAQFVVGQGHLEAKQYDEAAAALEKYLSAKPDGEVADFALGHLVHARLELGRIDEAFQALDQLAQRFPKSKVLNPTRLRVAESPLAVKDHADRALELLRQVIASNDPALKPQGAAHLGWLLLERARPPRPPPNSPPPSKRLPTTRTPPTSPCSAPRRRSSPSSPTRRSTLTPSSSRSIRSRPRPEPPRSPVHGFWPRPASRTSPRRGSRN